MKVTADHGLLDVKLFGWGDYTSDVIALLKRSDARYYLVVTDIDGNDVSIEIPKPEGVELKADVATGVKAARNIKLPVSSLEVEVPGEPPVELLGPSTATVELLVPGPKLNESKAPKYVPPGPPPPASKPDPYKKPAWGPKYSPKPGANAYPTQDIKVKTFYDQVNCQWVRTTYNQRTGEGTKEVVTEEQMRRGQIPAWLQLDGNHTKRYTLDGKGKLL